MWKISKHRENSHLSHIHGNLEIYIFEQDTGCFLCKEPVPKYITIQKKLLELTNYNLQSTRLIFYKFKTSDKWGKYDIENPFESYFPHDKMSRTLESKKEISELFKKYGYGINVEN